MNKSRVLGKVASFASAVIKFITSRHKPHTWLDSFQWRRSERWGHSRWSAGRSQCWTPEQSKVLKTILALRLKPSPDKAAERADRRCKIHPYRPDKTRLVRFQKWFCKHVFETCTSCDEIFIYVYCQNYKGRNAWNYSDIEQILSFYLNLSKYVKQFLLDSTCFLEKSPLYCLKGSIWRRPRGPAWSSRCSCQWWSPRGGRRHWSLPQSEKYYLECIWQSMFIENILLRLTFHLHVLVL